MLDFPTYFGKLLIVQDKKRKSHIISYLKLFEEFTATFSLCKDQRILLERCVKFLGTTSKIQATKQNKSFCGNTFVESPKVKNDVTTNNFDR